MWLEILKFMSYFNHQQTIQAAETEVHDISHSLNCNHVHDGAIA